MFKIFNRVKPVLPSKPEFLTFNNIEYIKRIPVKAGDRIVYLNSLPNYEQGYYAGITFVTNKFFNPFGSHTYSMYPKFSCMSGDYMEITSHKARKQGFGEIMRLASLIEMKENNLNDINICALPVAVPFHFKYRFRPDLKEQEDIKNFLTDIINNKSSVQGFKEKAEKLLENVHKCEYFDAGPDYRKQVNKLVKDYIMQNRLRWESAKFKHSLPMTLDWQTIKSNADFYNNLFKKHAIDYKV